MTSTSFDINLKVPVKEKAKYWFERKPYAAFDLRKGDSIEQTEIKSVPGITPGDS